MNSLFLLILLVVAGIVLLLLELFLLPGFGIAGISGFAALAGAVAVAYIQFSPTVGHIVLASILVLSAIAIWAFLRSSALDKMALKTDIDSKVDLMKELPVAVGDKVVCCSRLAPMGKVRLQTGEELEAKSRNGFINPETEVEVIAIEGNILIVK